MLWYGESHQYPWPQRTDVYTRGTETKTLAEWADDAAMPFQELAHRLHLHGLDILKVMPLPVVEEVKDVEKVDQLDGIRINPRPCRMLTLQGETLRIGLWAARFDLTTQLVGFRLRKGWTTERALMTPKRGKYTGGGSELSEDLGDRRGIIRSISDEIGVFPT